eukprot:m.401019 g.401019  ORF g.401019 m.401019 type:complete len:198 (-) comp16785_c1_seq12:459-1052(-)
MLAWIKLQLSEPSGRQSAFALQRSLHEESRNANLDNDLRELLQTRFAVTELWHSQHSMAEFLTEQVARLENGHAVLIRPHEAYMMAVDAILLTRTNSTSSCLFLQVTMNREHPLNSSRASDFLDQLVHAVQNDETSQEPRTALIYMISRLNYRNRSGAFRWQRQEPCASSERAVSLLQFALCPNMTEPVNDDDDNED